jgi:O-antigen/teichoic acid export membrane protein
VGQGVARLRRSAAAATAGAVAAGVVVVIVAFAVTVPVFGAGFAQAPGLLVVLVVAEVCFAPFFVTSRGLVGGGWTTAAGLLGVGGGVVAIAAYAAVTGPYGAAGAAGATVAVYAGLSVASYLLLRARFAPAESVGRHRG